MKIHDNNIEGCFVCFPIMRLAKTNKAKNWRVWDFPGGAVVKNPPANSGDMGSSPGPGRSHMPQSKEAPTSQLLSLSSRAREPQLLTRVPQLLKPARLEPMLRNKRIHCNEKPAHRNEE